MPSQTQTGQDVSLTKTTGALSSGDRYSLNLMDDDDLSFMYPADACVVESPKKADGTHANLTVRVNTHDGRTLRVLAGGGRVTFFGPIYSVDVVPDANVAGSGLDNVRLIFSGQDRTGR